MSDTVVAVGGAMLLYFLTLSSGMTMTCMAVEAGVVAVVLPITATSALLLVPVFHFRAPETGSEKGRNISELV